MPLPLRVFEPRYLAMIDEVLDRETLDFGVVLIERGHEVGGGDARFGVGTMARIEQVESGDGLAALVARGSHRFRVVSWLPDDPWPRAELTMVEPLMWDEDDRALLEAVERTVRHALVRASEFVEVMWGATVELSQDPVDRSWQLAGIAPLGTLDQVSLLESSSIADLLSSIDALTRDALELIEMQGGSSA